jgi:hypothetical protein
LKSVSRSQLAPRPLFFYFSHYKPFCLLVANKKQIIFLRRIQMSIKRIFAVTSVLAISVIMLFVYPSTDKSINAGQSNLKQDVTALANAHRISVSSEDVLVHYFGKDVVEKTMKQSGCVGVRMYYAKHANGRSGFVIVGVDKYGKDMVPTILAGPADVCPPWCGN